MYKIYKNEIKITNFLKGGATPDTLGSLNTLKKVHNSNGQLFSDDKNNFVDDRMKTEEIKHFDDIFTNPIDLVNGTDYAAMKTSIDRASKNVYLLLKIVFNGGEDVSDITGNDILNKNAYRYAVSFAKTIGLFDGNELLEFVDWKKKFNDENATNKALRESLLSETNVTGILSYFGISFNEQKAPKYRYELLIKRLKALKQKYGNEVKCKDIYPQITVKSKFSHWNPQLNFIGGAHENLNYILNGGVLNSIIRIPNMSNYFREQLNLSKLRLKNMNKALSEQSLQQINVVIDRLEKHEKELQNTFELLKNANKIEANVIDLKTHESDLKKAKTSVKKHLTYTGVLTSILETVLKAESSNEIKKYL